MKSELQSVVAVLEDPPEERLVRGQVATVVDIWASGVYEVAFADRNGQTTLWQRSNLNN